VLALLQELLSGLGIVPEVGLVEFLVELV